MTKKYRHYAACKNFFLIQLSNSREVPLIEKKIDFLSDLITSLKGADFIEHRAYLKAKKNSYESYKQEILIKEYLENGDIA